MPTNTLVLPIAGRAERILALPKYLLPINERETLLGSHINAALLAGFDRVLVIAREDHRSLLTEQLSYQEAVNISFIKEKTKTMCETLISGIKNQDLSGQITIALADSVVLGDPLLDIYLRIVTTSGNSLTLFRPRADQVGKLGQVDLDCTGKVIKMIDKDDSVQLPWIWGMSTFESQFLNEVDQKDAHIGISVQKWVLKGRDFLGITSSGVYFDCGTFSEYARYLESSNDLEQKSL